MLQEFIEYLSQIYYDGYYELMAETDAERLAFEFEEFQAIYG